MHIHTHTLIGDLSLSITAFIRRVERGFLRFLLSLSPSVPFSPEFRKIKFSYQERVGFSFPFFSFSFFLLWSHYELWCIHPRGLLSRGPSLFTHIYIWYTPSTLKVLYYSISYTSHLLHHPFPQPLYPLSSSPYLQLISHTILTTINLTHFIMPTKHFSFLHNIDQLFETSSMHAKSQPHARANSPS